MCVWCAGNGVLKLLVQNSELVQCTRMYCLQWLIPVLLLPKPVNPAFLYNHAMFVILYLLGFVLERRPCAICSLVFAAAVFLICYSWSSHCIVWPCEPSEVSSHVSSHWCSITDNVCKHINFLVVIKSAWTCSRTTAVGLCSLYLLFQIECLPINCVASFVYV